MNFYTIILFATATMMAEAQKFDLVFAFDNPYYMGGGTIDEMPEREYKFILEKLAAVLRNQQINWRNIHVNFYAHVGFILRRWKFSDDKTGSIYKLVHLLPKDFGSAVSAARGRSVSHSIEYDLIKAIDMANNPRYPRGAQKIVVFIVFRQHNDNPSSHLSTARDCNVKVFAIGIGNVDFNYLVNVTGSPARVINVVNTNQVNSDGTLIRGTRHVPSWLQNGTVLTSAFNDLFRRLINVNTPIRQMFKCDDRIDIVFVINSLSKGNEAEMIKTVTNFISPLSTGRHKIRFGIVLPCGPMLYSSRLGYKKYQALLTTTYSCVKSLSVSRSHPFTYGNPAMASVRKALEMFANVSDRRDAKDVLVFVTDKGELIQELADTVRSMCLARSIEPYVIGIGDAFYNTDGHGLFYYEDPTKFYPDVNKLCTLPTNVPVYVCNDRVDIVLLFNVGGSGNGLSMPYNIHRLLLRIPYGPNHAKLAVLLLCGNAMFYSHLQYDQEDSIEQISECENHIRRNGAGSMNFLTNGVNRALSVLFANVENRPNARDILVIITDKGGTSQQTWRDMLSQSKHMNITTYAFGIGAATFENVEVIDETVRTFYYSDSNAFYNYLPGICHWPNVTLCGCNEPVDIVFVLNALSNGNERSMLIRMEQLITKMTFGEDNIKLGLVIICKSTTIYAGLQHFKHDAIDIIRMCTEHTSNTASDTSTSYPNIGIEKAFKMFEQSPNRPDAPDVMVVITDKAPTNPQIWKEMIDRADQKDIELYAIGIGNARFNRFEMLGEKTRTIYYKNHDMFYDEMPTICN